MFLLFHLNACINTSVLVPRYQLENLSLPISNCTEPFSPSFAIQVLTSAMESASLFSIQQWRQMFIDKDPNLLICTIQLQSKDQLTPRERLWTDISKYDICFYFIVLI